MTITRPLRSQIVGYAAWLAVTFIFAALAAIASARAGAFYLDLARPPWAPPAWLFAPVWSVLYLLMATSAWLVWRGRAWAEARGVLTLFLVQLAVNALWTWLFFVGRFGALAFVEILLLWLLIAATIVGFWRLHRLAAALLLPYLAWVSLACALSYSTWQRNPGVLG